MNTRNLSWSKLFLISLWTVSLFTIALLIFTRGFLLTKIEFGNQTSGIENGKENIHARNNYDELTKEGNWPTFEKLLVIVIDGLRYDFLSHNSSILHAKSKHYQNKFVHLHDILSKSSENGRIFKFIADSPTTTVQRVKAITTGSLPSFVEASANFASTEILEDNIIHQLYKQNKSIVVMGDEVWVDLYPRYFLRQYPYPPFDVKDIDTVDNGVISHLIPEMKKHDWQVIIAHFLGVDHCGHSRGPDHPDMERKLKQMDQVLKDVIQHLDNKTIMYVFGDHGMTAAGGHGGGSPNEIHAGLLIYSKKKIFSKMMDGDMVDKAVRQVDIVPTISLQLNIPISFSNLGTVIEDIFSWDLDEAGKQGSNKILSELQGSLNLLTALRKNSKQVMFSVKEYFRISKDTEDKRLGTLERMFTEAEEQLHKLNCTYINVRKKASEKSGQMDLETIASLKALQDQYRGFLHQALLTCQEVWAQFDQIAIASGLATMILTLLCCFVLQYSINSCTYNNVPCKSQRVVLAEYIGLIFNILSWIIFTLQLKTPSNLVPFITAFQMVSIGCLLFSFWPIEWKIEHKIHSVLELLENSDGLALIMFFVYLGIFLADSITIQENTALLSLLQILLLQRLMVYFLKSSSDISPLSENVHKSAPFKRQSHKRHESFKVRWNYCYKLGIMFLVCCCIRMSAVYWNCREEQQPCIPSFFIQQLESIIHTADTLILRGRLSLAIFSVIVLWLCIFYWSKKSGNMNSSSSIYLCVKLLFPIGGLSILLHWALLIPSSNKLAMAVNLPWLQQVLLPRFAYGALLLAIFSLVWNPLGIYVLIRKKNLFLNEKISFGSNFDENVHTVFRNLRDSLNQEISRTSSKDNNEALPPMVYGLGTAYSTAFFALLVAFSLLIMMLLSDGLAFSLILMITTVLCLITDESIADEPKELETMASGRPLLSSLIIWSLLSSYWFFATGHQATIASIPFNAAFVGFQGDPGSRLVPGTLILMNLFAAQILFALSLPLLYIWNVSKLRLALPSGINKNVDSEGFLGGEMILRQGSRSKPHGLWITVFTYMTISMIKVLATACAAAFHSQHFMLWKVFAPRFVFEAAGFLFSLPFLFFGCFFFFRIDSALEKWTVKLEKAHKVT